jgi:hypothetical protein
MAVLMGLGIGLIVLALVLDSGGDDPGDSTTAADSTVVPTPGDQPAPGSSADGDASVDDAQGNSSGGSGPNVSSNASNTSSGNGDTDSGKSTKSPSGGGKQRSQSKRKDGPRTLTDLTPEERKKLHADLYGQGLRVCSIYGPAELARSFNLPATDPEQLARLYAEAYEAQSPSLILPVQQGCLVGLKRYIKRHP